MNKELLIWTRENLRDWTTPGRAGEPLTVEKRLDLIMFSLADMCSALAADTEDEADAIRDRK